MERPYLTEKAIKDFISSALAEDIGPGDHSSLGAVPAEDSCTAELRIKADGLMAGMELAEIIFRQVDDQIQFEPLKTDGEMIAHGEKGFLVSGNTRTILACERLVLNCLQRMSGVATYTHNLNQLIEGTGARLLDTRKTTPNFRLMEKWAVAIGGGVNHRYGLFDMVMLKDNHIDYAGSVRQAIQNTQKYLAEQELDLKIEVEVRNIQELKEVLATGGVFRVLLDNMLPSVIKEALHIIDGSVETEASGGINEKNIREIAETGVDYISVGALTHSYRSLDMSLKAKKI